MKIFATSCVRLIQYIISVSVHCAKFAGRWVWLCLITRQKTVARTAGEEVASLLEDLGPAFIKMGQVLSCRPDLIHPELANALSRLQNDVRGFPAAAVRDVLRRAYGTAPETVFKRFELRPLAAASVAQVHRAWLITGEDVAVKIRRPGIVQIVERDVTLLRAVCHALAALPFMRVVPLVELLEEVALPVVEQLDFVAEADNNRKLRRLFTAVERIRIPALVDRLCTPDVLVMEYVDGMQRVDCSSLTQYQKRETALAGLRALYRMIFRSGFVHADMHPGNVFIRNQGELVILDTGLVARLSDSDRGDFTDFFFGLANNDGRECARIVHENASYFSPRYSRVAFEESMVELVARHSLLKSSEFEVSTFVYQLIALQRSAGVRGSTKFIMTILAMVVFDGICKQLYPECEFQKEAKPFLIAARYDQGRRMALRV